MKIVVVVVVIVVVVAVVLSSFCVVFVVIVVVVVVACSLEWLPGPLVWLVSSASGRVPKRPKSVPGLPEAKKVKFP